MDGISGGVSWTSLSRVEKHNGGAGDDQGNPLGTLQPYDGIEPGPPPNQIGNRRRGARRGISLLLECEVRGLMGDLGTGSGHSPCCGRTRLEIRDPLPNDRFVPSLLTSGLTHLEKRA